MNGWTIRPPRAWAAACLLALLIIGCNLSRVTNRVTQPPPATPSPVSDWQIVAQGIERRDTVMRLSGGREARAALVRIDPAAVSFRVHYSPEDPHTINEWREILPQAAVIVNGSFFDEDRRALGLLASDGQHFGQSFMGFGGMFQVTESGPRVRSLVGEPYQGESFFQAVQAFPMLIEVGGVLASQAEGFTQRNRRTAIAQDWQGRIIIVVVAYDRVSLADLQGWLITSDLNVYIALGLDGGKSTGLVINTPGHSETIPNLDEVPGVIAVYGP